MKDRLMKSELLHDDGTGPVFLWFGAEDASLAGRIRALAPGLSFGLYACRVGRWDDELSPWPYASEGRCFSGDGQTTLTALNDLVLHEPAFHARSVFSLGYSLAGLFSLWAVYETGVLSGAICCSGSLWYPGWTQYASHARIKSPGALIYLSLGGKEARTPDPLMSTILRCTQTQLNLLRADANVAGCCLKMNPGGHFSDPPGRLAAGAAWVLSQFPGPGR